MFTRRIVLLIALGVALSGVAAFDAGSRNARADVIGVGLEPTGWLSNTGRYALLSGPMLCSIEDYFEVEATLVQYETGIESWGQTQAMCAGDIQQWVVHLVTADDALRLTEGAAQVCWTVTTWPSNPDTRQTPSDIRQYCHTITLATPSFAAHAG